MQGSQFDEAEFFRAIAASGTRALLIGRRALVALGIPVLTADYDFWIHIDDIAAFNAAVEPQGLLPTRTPDEARARGRYVLENDERIDVLIARTVPTVDGIRVAFEDVWPRRRALEVAAGVAIAVPELDDLILTKRFGGRPKDLEDIRLLEALRKDGLNGVNLVGFSLGGNFWLRVAARAAAARMDLARVVAVCPVLDPQHTMAQLERGWVLYRRYFLWKWRRSLRRKQQAWPGLYDLDEALRLGTLTAMTERLVRLFGDYPTMSDYLRGYSIVDDALASIVHPTRIISAADDPIIPAADLARLARPAALEITCTQFGGHCGFYEGGRGSTWIEREVHATLVRG